MLISDCSSDVCSSDLIGQIGREVTNGVWLQDACRYVDDIRLTITTAPGIDPTEAQARVMAWLGQLLTGSCPGLEFSPEKTSRSEEHTSELQSLMRISYAVFCLKKKTQSITQ